MKTCALALLATTAFLFSHTPAGFPTCMTVTSAQESPFPNDRFFNRQISFSNPGGKLTVDTTSRRSSPQTFTSTKGIDLNILEAWKITTGSPDVVVAILDDGYFYNHEDIRDNIWANPGETGLDTDGFPKESNGVDDDGNGYVDDVCGWDFAFNDPDPDAYIYDGKFNHSIQPNWHSIEALGIIGARGNNGVGVAGVNWNVSMMLLKLCAQGTWSKDKFNRATNAAKAIRYAADNGARIINWSGFVSGATKEDLKVLEEAIAYAAEKDVLLVLGAGNFGTDIDKEENLLFPQCFDSDNILNVAEITFDGRLDEYSGRHRVSSSSYGAKRVQIASIGRNFSTGVHHATSTYGLGGGTSCAAPVISGVAGLMLSVNPDLSYLQLKEMLIRTAKKLPALEGKITSGGMVDAHAAVQAAMKAKN